MVPLVGNPRPRCVSLWTATSTLLPQWILIKPFFPPWITPQLPAAAAGLQCNDSLYHYNMTGEEEKSNHSSIHHIDETIRRTFKLNRCVCLRFARPIRWSCCVAGDLSKNRERGDNLWGSVWPHPAEVQQATAAAKTATDLPNQKHI